MHNKDFENFIYKKALREGIDNSDGRDAQNAWGQNVSVLQDVVYQYIQICLFCRVAKYAHAYLNRFCRISHRSFESLCRSYPVPLTVSP